jgi:hypothetical protein
MTKSTSVVIILLLTSIIVFDSTIVQFFTFSGAEFSRVLNVIIFALFSGIFAFINIQLINLVKKTSSKSSQTFPLNLKYFHVIILFAQIFSIGILLIILLQMIFLNNYHLLLLRAEMYLSHISALVFILLTTFMFLGWLKSRKNSMIFIYSISFAIVSINIVISVIYLDSLYVRSYVTTIRPYPIHLVVITQTATVLSELLGTTFDALSIVSFIVFWIASFALLSQYRYKIGKVKFYALMVIPLIYYLFPFEAYFGNIFSPLKLNSPVTFGAVYVLIFSATKQVGALLFSLTFLTASSLVGKKMVRTSLLISAIGMTLLYGSIQIHALQYKIFPPFGLITEAFMPIGAFLLFTGIFTSARAVAQDAQLREDFYKSAQNQLSLFRTLGVTQMEKELVKKFKNMEKRAIQTGRTEEPYQEEEDVKQIVREVLNELYSKKSGRIEKSDL